MYSIDFFLTRIHFEVVKNGDKKTDCRSFLLCSASYHTNLFVRLSGSANHRYVSHMYYFNQCNVSKIRFVDINNLCVSVKVFYLIISECFFFFFFDFCFECIKWEIHIGNSFPSFFIDLYVSNVHIDLMDLFY